MSHSMPPAIPTHAAPQSVPVSNRYKWKVLSTVLFGSFMVILDTTVINVAFETLRMDFGASLNDSQWIISIYVLALGITTPLAGFLADRYDEKKIYLGGLGLFAFGSLLCGLSPSLGFLIAARAIQGVGGGVVMPLGTALLLKAFPAKEQGMALGFFGIAGLVAPAVGPILGGWLVDLNLWRVIFFINPPIGVLGVILGIRFLQGQPHSDHLSLDIGGVVTEIIGFGAILYAASIASSQGWATPSTLLWFGIGAAGLILFGLNELFFSRHPLLDIRMFTNRVFLNASLLGYISTVALFGAEFLLPIYLQALRGRSALETGLILLPMAITGGISVTLSGRIYDKVGPRPLMVAGFAFLTVNTWQLAQIRGDTAITWILFLLVLRGLALGLTVQTTMVTALSVVTRRDLARGSSLTNATRLVIQSIGVAMLATVLAAAISPEVQTLQNELGHKAALCEPATIAQTGGTGGALSMKTPGSNVIGQVVDPPPASTDMLARACQENISGFERAYKVTFYAAFVALLLGLMLPGWPGKWDGRKEIETPVMSH